MIDENEQAARRKRLQKICHTCHSAQWVENKFLLFENTVDFSNKITLTATKILQRAWEKGLAQNDNIFDEAIEKKWVEQWLFYANSTRFASARGGADYGVFDNGRWYMSKISRKWPTGLNSG